MTTSGRTPDYQRLTYLFMCTDPVHVGTGGYRLGRVDNSIVRDPGTNVPKIPGSSLHGAARAYAASVLNRPSCAGQGNPKRNDTRQNGQSGHCGVCPVCYTFGYSKNTDDQSAYSGTVNVFDAEILLFPVHSLEGPVWITTKSRLERLSGAEMASLSQPEHEESVIPLFETTENILTLGWLVLAIQPQNPEEAVGQLPGTLPEQIANHIVLVHENLFSNIVNSNLEIRTSVAINPERGAAEDGALFTYEAIPRTTILAADVVIDDYHQLHSPDNGTAACINPQEVLEGGLRLISWLGVGGMGTRGFGRMEMLEQPEPEHYRQEETDD
ncbi:type III-B CRISPR module RAMP protein Cmr4 [Prosthecochloris sp. GSB1]|uniref:type III-B CRISPR module RAMP protein Cmr4 n=1 Tax=Prosthecochloris sp. GSB1 TaxID=281093 RepID=UPI000B8CCEA2|nr:type III-B CRISPR module RAMP protein Cmr4 [Prosthecochloris sp. GSB1]ASQ90552.1 type III-B CRISPR module RAMP protein Cmr4 [Prosthecochloris sp. GSB1]